MLGDIERLKSKEKNGGLSKDEQIELHHAETLLARAQITNLETKQKALSKLPTPRDLHPTELDALAKAKAMLASPWPGTATATSGHTGTGDTPGTTSTGTTTSTASSGGTIPPSTGSGSGTHTTNGVTAPPVGHGNLIPEDTTHAEHIDLANRRTENLEKIARKRPLNPHEQEVYDNARRVRDRNSPALPGDRNSPPPPTGSRNTGDPDHLAMSGDEDALVPVTPDGEDATLDAEDDTPPVSPPAQPANAIGTTIEGSGATNPDAPTASSVSPAPPPSTSPAGAPQTTGNAIPASASPPISSTPPATASGSTTTTASASISTSPSSNAGGSPSTSPPSNSPAPSNSGNGNTPPPSYPPIDYDHIVGGDVNAQGTRVTGGHSLHRGDVRIVPGTELPPNPVGVYRAQVQIKHPTTGIWTTKVNHNGNPIVNTMFPKSWSEHKIKAEVDAAWASPSKVITGNRWMSITPSGVKIIGYINTSPHLNRVTAYPDY